MPSAIEWTDETWNPVTGCTRVSPGCDNCYMYALYPRLNAMGVPGYGPSPANVTPLPERLMVPFRWKKPRRIFVNSMSDLFHPEVSFEFILDVFQVMKGRSFRTWSCFPGPNQAARPGRSLVEHAQEPVPRGLAYQRLDRDISREPKICPKIDCIGTVASQNQIRFSRALARADRFDSLAGTGSIAVGHSRRRKRALCPTDGH